MLTFLRISPVNAAILESVADGVFDHPVDPEKREICVSSPDRIQLVAVEDGVVVGQLLAVIHRHIDKQPELYIDDLGVAPSRHRRGIARRLMRKAQGIALAGGLSGIWVAVDPGNDPAKALYTEMGMQGRPVLVFEMPVSTARS